MTFIRLASNKEVLCGTRFSCWHPAQSCTLSHDRRDVFCSYLAFHSSGLSATIGSPEIFNDWLQSVQEAHGFKHTFIENPHRYSHSGEWSTSLDHRQAPSRSRFLHPISLLFAGIRSLPNDVSLEASGEQSVRSDHYWEVVSLPSI